MEPAALAERLATVPRIPLAHYPTPLEPLKQLSRQGKVNLWCKHDDGIGPAMGGSKTRGLEYLMAEARCRKARKVVTFGGVQSNHARITAAVARQIGLEPHLIHFESRPRIDVGNQLFTQLLDAKRHFVPFGNGGGMTLETTNRLVKLMALALVGPAFFIPVGGHSVLGCLGYVSAALELDEQVRRLGIENAVVVTAAGSGGTLAGLMAGFRLIDSQVRVLGIDVGRLWRDFPASIARLASATCAFLSEPRRFGPRDVPLIEHRYVGVKYGVPTPEGNAAICRVATAEGIFLDPVYTGKAMAGLLDLASTGYFPRDSNVIFLHTGGAPALFAFGNWPAN